MTKPVEARTISKGVFSNLNRLSVKIADSLFVFRQT